MLLAILLMMTLLVIAATAVAPKLATQIKRQREEELIHRGTQYAKAIRLFYRKFGRYPTSLDQLESTNNMRFLRKRYKDPITGKDDWRLIHFGEAKNALNLFGVASSGTGSAATGLGGVSAPGAFGGQSTPTVGTPAGQTPAGQSTPGQTPGQSSPSSAGQTFGGGPIIGVASPSEAESLMELQGKDHYNQWEFVYDPRYDRQAAGAAGAGLPGMGGAPVPGQGTPTGGAPAPGQGTPTAPPAAGPPGMGGPPKPP